MNVRQILTTLAHSNTAKGIVGGIVVAARVDYMAYQAAKKAGHVDTFFTEFNWSVARNRYLHGAIAGGAAGIVTDAATYFGVDFTAILGLAQQ